MSQLGVPHFTVLTKCDLVGDKDKLSDAVDLDIDAILDELRLTSYSNKFKNLTNVLGRVVSEYNLVNFSILDRDNEDSIVELMYNINMSLQYGENEEVSTRDQDTEMD